MSAIDDAAAAIQAAVQIGLQQGDGTVAGISTDNAAAITAAVVALQDIATPIIASTDAAAASQALDMSARAAIILTVLAAPGAGVRLVQAVNPNLFAIAVQYLGDASRWLEIARASGVTDPQPVGQFALMVPAK